MAVARARLEANFSKAALDYDALAEFQHTQTQQVLDSALALFRKAGTVLDIGCGTGYFAHRAQKQRPQWRMVGVDIAQGMCMAARSRCAVARADAVQLPLRSASADGAVSSLCYQWVNDIPAAFAELARVLKPGGLGIIATLGRETLKELRSVAAHAELSLGLLPMREMEVYVSAALRAGLEIAGQERTLSVQHYPNMTALLNSMRSVGAGNNFVGEKRGLTGVKRWNAMTHAYERLRVSAGLPATWDHLFFVVRKPV